MTFEKTDPKNKAYVKAFVSSYYAARADAELIAQQACKLSHLEGYQKGFETARAKYEPRWIPVSEELPEIDKQVLCIHFATGIPFIATRFKDPGNAFFIWEDSNGRYRDASYWMPIPAEPAAPETVEEGEG